MHLKGLETRLVNPQFVHWELMTTQEEFVGIRGNPWESGQSCIGKSGGICNLKQLVAYVAASRLATMYFICKLICCLHEAAVID